MSQVSGGIIFGWAKWMIPSIEGLKGVGAVHDGDLISD